MRLVAKLTVGLMLGLCAVLTVHAGLRIERERRLIESDMAREQQRIGQLLALALPRLWQADGDAAADAVLAGIVAQSSGLQIRLLDAPPPSPPGPTVEPRDGARHLVTRVPLVAGAERPRTVELAESLAGEDTYVRHTLLAELGTAAALLLTTALLAVAVGAWLVGRPTRRLLQRAQRIGSGDFGRDAMPVRRDEFGDLSRAMDDMAERLAALHRTLAAETAQRLAALEQMRHADRLATVGTLASAVAHELGTPLNVVAEYGRMIETEGLSGIERRAAGRTIVHQSERMTATISQLLDFARRARGERRPTELVSVVRRTLGLLAPLARRHDIALALVPPDGPFSAEVDEVQLQHALANLIVNAIHAEPSGGRIIVRLGRGRPADRPAGPADGWLHLTVIDHGAGIAPADLPHVLEPFFTTKPVGSGTGLGLSLAHDIAIEHGGRIAIDSTPGRGTRASILLRENGSPVAHAHPRSPARPHRERVSADVPTTFEENPT